MSTAPEKKPARKKGQSLKALLGLLPMLLMGGLIGGFGAHMIISANPDIGFFAYMLEVTLLVVYFIVAFVVQIVIHEGGHLIFGLLTGYRFLSFNIMGVIWQKGPDGKIRVGRMQIAGAGGQCLMTPPAYQEGHFPFVLYNLGGVLMNLIASAIFFALSLLPLPTALDALLMSLCVIGVGCALLNGLPLPVEAIQNDASNLLCIRKNLHARRAFWIQMALAAEQGRGRRMKDMPAEWFEPFPEEAMSNPIVAAVPVFNANRLMDALDFAGAEAAIRQLLRQESGMLPLYRMLLTLDGCVCELIAGRPGDLTANADTPENQQMMKAMPTNPTILRTRYCKALLAEKDPQKAEKLLADFDKAAAKYPHPQDIVAEREILQAIQAAAEKGGA